MGWAAVWAIFFYGKSYELILAKDGFGWAYWATFAHTHLVTLNGAIHFL
jgi:hypothetical protein